MSVVKFEDKRWRENSQKIEFRHRACAGLINGGTVLDIGCGDGLLLKMLRDKGIEASGVDISPEAIVICRAAGFEASEHSLDDALPYPDNTFNTVTLLDVLEHVYDPLFVLKEATRVARNNIIISVPNFSSLPARLQVLRGAVPENNRPHKGHLYWFNWPVLQSIAGKCGLRIVLIRTNAIWERVPFIGAISNSLASALPNLFALSFVVELERL